MKINVVPTKNDKIIYLAKSVRKEGKVKTVNIKKLGKLSELSLKYDDPIAYCKNLAKELTEKEKENNQDIIISLSQIEKIELNKQNTFNAGYLFLQKIYYGLKLDKICNDIKKENKFEFDLNKILKDLIFSRIIYPSSKLSTFELSHKYLEQPNYDIQNVYRALDVLSQNINLIQKKIYKNSLSICDRNTKILYYDCTNYFFEIEECDDFRKYGLSKEHRPNPIVQMGLFMDGNGIPLAFNINPGNTSEQVTVSPTEKMIINDFKLSKFIYCSDAGLGSNNNRYLNSYGGRSFIVTQSIKKLPQNIKEIIFENNTLLWKSTIDNTKYKEIDELENMINASTKKEDVTDTIFKVIPLTDKQIKVLDELEEFKGTLKNQNLIITYSHKYKRYQEALRKEQFERAKKYINSKSKFNKKNVTDCKRFIKNIHFDKNGEVTNYETLELNYELFTEESKYDGYYCLATDLQDNPIDIIKINSKRWEIEESFRIMKTDFKARPIYLQLENRIKAHFLTCYLALLIYRILEQKINIKDNHFTTKEIITTLKDYNLLLINDICYTPTFKRTIITDQLEKIFNLDFSFKGLSNTNVNKKIFSSKR